MIDKQKIQTNLDTVTSAWTSQSESFKIVSSNLSTIDIWGWIIFYQGGGFPVHDV